MGACSTPSPQADPTSRAFFLCRKKLGLNNVVITSVGRVDQREVGSFMRTMRAVDYIGLTPRLRYLRPMCQIALLHWRPSLLNGPMLSTITFSLCLRVHDDIRPSALAPCAASLTVCQGTGRIDIQQVGQQGRAAKGQTCCYAGHGGDAGG